MLQRCVDALKLAFRVPLDDIEFARMRRVLDAGEPAGYSIGGMEFELGSLGGRSLRLVLNNATASVCVGPDANGFCITVELRALFLRTTPFDAAIAFAQNFAQQFAAAPFADVRVRRVDLCADATGLAFSREDEDKFVTRARGRVRYQAPDSVYTQKTGDEVHVTGFSVAPGNSLMVRIYDKTAQLLAVYGKDSDKTLTELETYRLAGWDGESPVWRVEAQFRTDVLRQLNAGTPELLLKSLDSLWHYVVGAEYGKSKAWLRLVELGSASRIERSKTDARWKLYQSASFSGSVSVERVPGRRGGVTPENALGAVLSLLGASSNLGAVDEDLTSHEVMLSDFERAAEVLAANPYLLMSYRQRRGAARARFWAPPGPGKDEL